MSETEEVEQESRDRNMLRDETTLGVVVSLLGEMGRILHRMMFEYIYVYNMYNYV